MPNKYRKRPVVIEAFRYNTDPRPDWFQSQVSNNSIITFPDHCVIRTLEGQMRGEVGDWIIHGVKDEIYPCKPDIFEMTYESVEGTYADDELVDFIESYIDIDPRCARESAQQLIATLRRRGLLAAALPPATNAIAYERTNELRFVFSPTDNRDRLEQWWKRVDGTGGEWRPVPAIRGPMQNVDRQQQRHPNHPAWYPNKDTL